MYRSMVVTPCGRVAVVLVLVIVIGIGIVGRVGIVGR
jgi:hypothetical protein